MSDSLGHLIGRAGLVEWRVRALIAERRAVDVAPDDAFRGLYLSDEVVDQLLDGVADAPVPVETEPAARGFRLNGARGPVCEGVLAGVLPSLELLFSSLIRSLYSGRRIPPSSLNHP